MQKQMDMKEVNFLRQKPEIWESSLIISCLNNDKHNSIYKLDTYRKFIDWLNTIVKQSPCTNICVHILHIYPKDIPTSSAEKHFKVNVIVTGELKVSQTNLCENICTQSKCYGLLLWSSRTPKAVQKGTDCIVTDQIDFSPYLNIWPGMRAPFCS